MRYYDKEGFLPFVDRNAAGRRRFKDNDFNFLEVIVCLKEAGVPVKQIGDFIDLCMTGDTTLQARYDFLDDHEAELEAKMARLQHTLDFLRWKKWYYKAALQAGTESIHYLPGTNPGGPSRPRRIQPTRGQWRQSQGIGYTGLTVNFQLPTPQKTVIN